MKILPLRSLNARLLLAILASIIVALAIGGTIIHQLFKQRLLDDLDSSLSSELAFHAQLCVQQTDGFYLEYRDDSERHRENDPQNEIFAQYRFADGGRHFRYSPSLEEKNLPPIGLNSRQPIYETIILFNGNPARAVGIDFIPTNRSDEEAIRMHVVIAKELTGVIDSLAQLRKTMWQVATGITILLLATTAIILRSNLKPLKHLSDQIAATPVTAGDVRHFNLESGPAELDPVVRRLNALMDRVEGAFERERQFTANAAHELRNPLAGMRSQIELSLGGDRPPEKHRETFESLYDIQQGMERVVENLLILARLESGQEQAQQEIVPITEVLRRGWRKVYDAAEQREIAVTWEVQPDMPVLKTSRNLISIIVRNLLDNAVDYSPQGGKVKIAAHYDHLISSATIRVANQNTRLTKEDCEKMFDLFWRGSQDEGVHRHAGLGLGLCRRIVHVLRGEMKARLTEGDQWIEFTCTFPCETLTEAPPT